MVQHNSRRQLINITSQVQQCLEESGIKEGLILCNAMHITSSVFINDDESGLHHDFEVWLEKLAPEKPYSQYQHNGFEDNADAHLKRTIMGREIVVAITAGKMDFGPWEQIFYGEFDGKRSKRVLGKDHWGIKPRISLIASCSSGNCLFQIRISIKSRPVGGKKFLTFFGRDDFRFYC